MPPKERPFSLQGKNLFLTYAQCPLSKEHALTALQDRFENLIGWVVARELHQDGNAHLHIYLQFSDTFKTRDPRFADLEHTYHPNAQSVRSSKSVVKYCTKESDYLANIDVHSIAAAR